MIVHYGCKGIVSDKPAVIATGTFDGVHLGHKAILDILKKRAEEISGESVVVTFDPHPRKVIGGETGKILLLNSPEEKIRLIEESGINHLVILKFDRELSNLNAAEFFGEIIAGRMKAKHLVAGFNHHFGKMAAGNAEMIRETAEKLGISCDIVEPVSTGGMMVSSSAIREALAGGRLDQANMMLGYHYSLEGIIVEGMKIGRKIGYPTANVKPCYPDKLIPADGVYAVEVKVSNYTYNGVMSIGFNPTVKKLNRERTLEVFIEGFEGNIYGKEVKVVFRFRLRDEMFFSSTEELARQIEKDRREALRFLKK